MVRALLITLLLGLHIAVLPEDTPRAQEEEVQADADALPVSTAHALFGKKCPLCHEPFRGPTETLCQQCHAGPLHTGTQAVTPVCWTCHQEHSGQKKLADLSNDQCVSCHANLETTPNAPLQFAAKVTDFVQDHPEFALTLQTGKTITRLRLTAPHARQADRTALNFTHKVHLAAGLKSPRGPVQLECLACHRVAGDGLHMEPIRYDTRCQPCHKLVFDPQFPSLSVPHEPPERVHAALLVNYTQHRRQASRVAASVPQRGRITRPTATPRPAAQPQTVAQKVTAAERVLYRTTCKKCHAVNPSTRPFPTIPPTAVPSGWFPHAQFSHRAHRLLTCAACHTGVPQSNTTRDVLLPSIQLCRQCHKAETTRTARTQYSAPTDCLVCHIYHDKSRDIEWNGTFTLQQLLPDAAGSRNE